MKTKRPGESVPPGWQPMPDWLASIVAVAFVLALIGLPLAYLLKLPRDSKQAVGARVMQLRQGINGAIDAEIAAWTPSDEGIDGDKVRAAKGRLGLADDDPDFVGPRLPACGVGHFRKHAERPCDLGGDIATILAQPSAVIAIDDILTKHGY